MSNISKFADTLRGRFSFAWSVQEHYPLLASDTYVPVDITGVDAVAPWLKIESMGEFEAYAPLMQGHLHRKFAAIDPYDEQAITGFVGQHGHLGYPVRLIPRGVDKSDLITPQGQKHIVWGESLSRWQAEISDMGLVLAIWDMVASNQAGKLGELFSWRQQGRLLRLACCYEYSPERGGTWKVASIRKRRGSVGSRVFFLQRDVVSKAERPELTERWSHREVVEPAKYWVCQEVNRRLRGNVSPVVFPFVDNKVFWQPHSLYAALWCLVLEEITGILSVRQCNNPGCNKWISAGSDGETLRGRPASYCSDRCKQQAYRLRKHQATQDPHGKKGESWKA